MVPQRGSAPVQDEQAVPDGSRQPPPPKRGPAGGAHLLAAANSQAEEDLQDPEDSPWEDPGQLLLASPDYPGEQVGAGTVDKSKGAEV